MAWWLRTSPCCAARVRRQAAALPLPPLPSLFPGACSAGAPTPRPPAAAPPRLPPHAALAPLRKGLGASPWGHGPSTGQVALWGGGRAGRGAGLRARILLGSGTSCTAQGGRWGGDGSGEGTALQLLRPRRRRPPPPPEKRSSSSDEAHRCLHYIMSPPLPPRPPRTSRLGGDRDAVRVARLETAQRPYGGLSGGSAALSPGRLRGGRSAVFSAEGREGREGDGWLRSPGARPTEG